MEAPMSRFKRRHSTRNVGGLLQTSPRCGQLAALVVLYDRSLLPANSMLWFRFFRLIK